MCILSPVRDLGCVIYRQKVSKFTHLQLSNVTSISQMAQTVIRPRCRYLYWQMFASNWQILFSLRQPRHSCNFICNWLPAGDKWHRLSQRLDMYILSTERHCQHLTYYMEFYMASTYAYCSEISGIWQLIELVRQSWYFCSSACQKFSSPGKVLKSSDAFHM